MRQWCGSEFSSDHAYNWSDSTTKKYIFQPICLDLVSISSKVTNSRSECASSFCGGNIVGSAQSVHSRATLKLPRSDSRRISVSTPATRRFLSTSKRWPCMGWKGWRISAHPKSKLGSSAVRVDRPDASGPGGADRSQDRAGTDFRGGFGTKCLWLPTEAKRSGRNSESASANLRRLHRCSGRGSVQIL